jgi:opacity protein-like surface antigen
MGNSNLGFGVSGRATIHDRFGVQLQASRYSPSTVVGQPHLTSFQLAPSFLYALPDKLTDYIWMRPYVGAGMIAYRSTVSVGAPATESVKDSRWGRQLFGGVELAIASLPRFGLSVDYGYRWSDALNEFDFGGPALSMSGHWYVK